MLHVSQGELGRYIKFAGVMTSQMVCTIDLLAKFMQKNLIMHMQTQNLESLTIH